MSLEEIGDAYKNELPFDFIKDLSEAIKIQNKIYHDELKNLDDDPNLIKNEIYFENNSQIHNLLKEQAHKNGMSWEVMKLGSWRYCVVKTKNINMIIRSQSSDFDTALVQNFGVYSGNELFDGNDKFSFEGSIPIILVYSINSKSGEIIITPKIYDSLEKKSIDLSIKHLHFKRTNIMDPESQKEIVFEKQPSLTVKNNLNNQS